MRDFSSNETLAVGTYIWDTGTLAWIKSTGSGGGGGGGAVTVVDGGDVNAGSTTDAAVTTDTTGTLSSKLRGLVAILSSVWDSGNGRLKVDGSAVTQPISGDVGVLSVTGTGSIANNQVSVTTTSSTVVTSRAGRRSLLIVNHGTTDVFLGTGTVTTSNGLLLKGTAGASVSIPTSAAVNGIVASGTQTVSYLEVF